MISNLARGSIFLGVSLLLAVFFCFQPRVEANDSQNNLQTNFNQTDIQQNNLINEQSVNPQSETPSETSENESKIENKSSSAAATLAFKATAYCLQGRTASGGGVRRGIVAADTRVLPLGTRIQMTAGAYSGTYTVADTGGVVKGRILDVWVPSCSEAMRFGRKTVMVSVLSKKGK
jgi:3D (Asp-Asp-Asp) domain-containing protein